MIKFLKKIFLKLKKEISPSIIKDIFRFNPEENLGPERWHKRYVGKFSDTDFSYIPSLLALGLKCGYIQVNSLEYSFNSDIEKYPQLTNDKKNIIKKATCMSRLTSMYYNHSIDFWGVRGRSIPYKEILRLETEYFKYDSDYLDFLEEWDKISLTERLVWINETLKPTNKRFIYPSFKQEFLNQLIKNHTKHRVPVGILLRYFNNPIYLDSNFKYAGIFKNDNSQNFKNKNTTYKSEFYKEAIKLGIVYLKINKYTLANYSVDTIRDILKNQTEKTKELQKKAFEKWLSLIVGENCKNLYSLVKFINSFKKKFKIKEKINLLYKYLKLQKHLSFIIFKINKIDFWDKRSKLRKSIDKRIGKYKWYNEKLLSKIISLDTNGFLVNYPEILIKNIRTNNFIIFETLAFFQDCIDKILERSIEKKIECWIVLTRLEQFFSSSYISRNDKWKMVEDYVKEYIYTSIKDQKERIENNLKKNPYKSILTNLGDKISFGLPFLGSNYANFLGKDFHLTSLITSSDQKKFPFKFYFKIQDTQISRTIQDNVLLYNKNIGIYELTDENSVIFNENADEWFLVCVRDFGYRLSADKSYTLTTPAGEKCLYNIIDLYSFKNSKLNYDRCRVIAVVHVPTQSLFSGFKSNNEQLILNLGDKKHNDCVFDTIISYLKPIINVREFFD